MGAFSLTSIVILKWARAPGKLFKKVDARRSRVSCYVPKAWGRGGGKRDTQRVGGEGGHVSYPLESTSPAAVFTSQYYFAIA